MIHTEYFICNPFQERCTIAWDDEGFCVITDPGCTPGEETGKIFTFIASKGLRPVCVMLTHAHFDHIYGAASAAREYGIPIYMHPEETSTIESVNPMLCKAFGLPLPESFTAIRCSDGTSAVRFVREGDTVQAGTLCFEVIETPGHTAGGACYLERAEKTMFSGDTLFAGSIGRTDHPGGDYDRLIAGILGRLMVLDGDIEVIPGHGPVTSIATERMTNPFLQPFNEPYED